MTKRMVKKKFFCFMYQLVCTFNKLTHKNQFLNRAVVAVATQLNKTNVRVNICR